MKTMIYGIFFLMVLITNCDQDHQHNHPSDHTHAHDQLQTQNDTKSHDHEHQADADHSHDNVNDPNQEKSFADHTHENGDIDHSQDLDAEVEHEAPASLLVIGREKEKIAGIAWEKPTKAEYRNLISLSGVVETDQRKSALIQAKVTGTVTAVYRDIGQSVKAGETLCLINSPEILKIKSDYVKTLQTFLNLKKNYDRAKELFTLQGIELKELQNRETEYKHALADYLSMEAELKSKDISANQLETVKIILEQADELKLKEFLTANYPLRTPINGQVIRRDLLTGEYLEVNRTVFEIADLNSLWVHLDVRETEWGLIEKNQTVRIVCDAFPTELFLGTVQAVDEKVEAKLRTMKIRVQLENQKRLLKPNMFVKGILAGKSQGVFFRIPTESLVKIAAVNGVFLRKANGFSFAPVQIMGNDFQGFSFVSGLSEQYPLVVSGAFYVKAEFEINKAGGLDPHAGHNH
jgi:cobalt-zinc-cadmium efflux system membrane fusion protein